MKKEHVDPELYEILHFKPKTTPEIQDKIDDAYERIRHGKEDRHSRKRRRAYFYLASAAAVIFILGFLGFSNPALAGKIPFIGRIFRLIENKVGYPGDFSSNSIPLADPETENNDTAQAGDGTDRENNAAGTNTGDSQTSESKTGSYTQTNGDITVTLSEACYTEMALYFSLELYSEEGFPEDFCKIKTMEDYVLSYDNLYIRCSQELDFSQADPALYITDKVTCSAEYGLPTPHYINGNYMDSHTFLGVIRIDIDEIKRALNVDALAPEFTYSLDILEFWGELNTYTESTATLPDTGETIVLKDPERKYYNGPWHFTVPVSIDQTQTITKEIMETNEEGVGISRVTKTPYEIKAYEILPDGAFNGDYFVSITDADGTILESQGELAEVYSTYGRNTDTIHIYVVDYTTYMDECRGKNAYLLPEKALFHTTVNW